MKIMVVDDSKMMRMIVIRTLKQAGFGHSHTFQEAADGAEALRLMQTDTPELVLSDWNMPQMSGLEFVQQMHVLYPTIKFGFITSEGTPEIRQKAKEVGAKFLITKPFNEETFRQVFDSVIMVE